MINKINNNEYVISIISTTRFTYIALYLVDFVVV